MQKRHAAEQKAAKAKMWSEEEVRMLEKALVKFPQASTLLSVSSSCTTCFHMTCIESMMLHLIAVARALFGP